MLSTADFRRIKIETGNYGYQGYRDNAGRKWMMKYSDCDKEAIAYSLATYLRVKAPKVKPIVDSEDPSYSAHIVEYFDNASVAEDWRAKVVLHLLNGKKPYVRPSFVKSAIRMAAFDALHLDNDRHDQNYMVVEQSGWPVLASIDLEGAFEVYASVNFDVRPLSQVIRNSDILVTFFGDGKHDGRWVKKDQQMNLNPKDYFTPTEARRLIDRVKNLDVDAYAKKMVPVLYYGAERADLVKANLTLQRDQIALDLAAWLL